MSYTSSSILFINAPGAFPPEPPLGISALKAYLKQHGISDTGVYDANLDHMHYCLEKEHLRENLELAHEIKAQMEKQRMLDHADHRLYLNCVCGVAFGEKLLSSIENHIAYLHYGDGRGGYAWNEYRRSMRGLKTALQLSLLPFSSYNDLWADARISCMNAVEWATSDDNPWLPFAYSRFVPILHAHKPSALGISVSYRAQLLPALVLAALAKRESPHITNVMGGAFLATFREQLGLIAPLFQLVDHMVIGPGEEPMLQLAGSIQTGCATDHIPGAYLLPEGGSVLMSPAASPTADDLPTPDFSDLPLGDYLQTDRPVLPLLTTKGCYWRKCAFCTHHSSYLGHFSMRSAEKIAADMQGLRKEHGTNRFYLTDDSMPIPTLKALSGILIQRQMDVEWIATLRFEPSLDEEVIHKAAAAGCRMLVFGLESYNDRVLQLMGKGTRVELVRSTVDACLDAGITPHVMAIVGFPGETMEECEATAHQLTHWTEQGVSIGISLFRLNYGSPICRDPDRYNVRLQEPQQPVGDVLIDVPFETTLGMTRAESIAMFDRITTSPAISRALLNSPIMRSHLLPLGHLDNSDGPALAERLKTNQITLVHTGFPLTKLSLVGGHPREASPKGLAGGEPLPGITASASKAMFDLSDYTALGI